MPPTEPPDAVAKRRRRLAEHFAATQPRQPQTRGYPTVDGAVRHPTIGGVPVTPVMKVRPRRNRRA